MKKIYIRPVSEQLYFAPQGMLAGSPTEVNVKTESTSTVSGGSAYSQQFDWDNNDWEEE